MELKNREKICAVEMDDGQLTEVEDPPRSGVVFKGVPEVYAGNWGWSRGTCGG